MPARTGLRCRRPALRAVSYTHLGITYEEIATLYPIVLQQGSRGFEVRALQYYLNVLAKFYPTYYPVAMDGIFGPETDRAVRRFQEYNGLTADGVVGNRTWERMDQVYRSVIETIPSTGNRARPVSYTHLDVYKRQVLRTQTPMRVWRWIRSRSYPVYRVSVFQDKALADLQTS